MDAMHMLNLACCSGWDLDAHRLHCPVSQQGHREATCLLSLGGAVRACVASHSDAACRRSHRGHATQDPQDVRSTLRPKPQPHCPLCSKHVCAYALLLCCIRRPIPTPQPCRERVDGVLSTTAAAIPNIHACAMCHVWPWEALLCGHLLAQINWEGSNLLHESAEQGAADGQRHRALENCTGTAHDQKCQLS